MLEWLLGRDKTGPHFPKMVPSLLPPQTGGEGTFLDSKSSLTCVSTHILLLLWVLGKSCSLEKACQGLFPPSFSSPFAGGRLLTSCSLTASLPPHHFTSAQTGSSSPLYHAPLPHSFLAHLSHYNPLPTLQKFCIHLALIWLLP